MRWGLIPLHCMQSNSLLSIKEVRSLDLLHGTRESPPEIPHKSRRTLMSPEKCEIAWCRPNKLEVMPDSTPLAPEQYPVPHHTRHVAWLPLGNYRDSLRHTSQVYRNINFITGTRGKLHAPYIISRRELFPRILLKRLSHFPQKHLKRSLPSAIGMWEGPWVCFLRWSGYRDAMTRKKVVFPWTGLNGDSFSSHKREGCLNALWRP